MTDNNPTQETLVTPKSPEAAKDAPPSLAEPASGPVAEMTGALPVGQPAPKPSPSPATVPAPVSDPAASAEASAPGNSAFQPAEDKAETSNNTEAPAASPQGAEEPSEEKPIESAAEQDTEMKDASSAPAAEDEATPTANGAAASKAKRKSTGGVPEHKSKTLKKKQSKAKITNLDAKPGDYYLARLKSYPPWPSIICDEDMLPDVLLNSRPKTAIKDDGTYHEDYAEGGKKVSERTYAVMFLHTNEFGWIPNTDLQSLDPESCKDTPEKGKSKMLIEAYKVAAEGHDLDHFKEVLMAHDAALQEEENKQAERQAAKAAKTDKKAKRKSEVKAADSDTEMADADADDAAPKKASKKRKKDAETDEEGPEKTPKTTKLKLTTGKTPTTEKKTKEKAPAKPKADKRKKAASEDEKEAKQETPPKDPVQARKDQEKEVLFLRHKLQKGFLSRDQEPSEDEMPQMANFIKKLEGYGANLDASIIRTTKINKVLKGILKLSAIPKDEEYHFKDRSAKILADWAHILGTESTETSAAPKKDESTSATTNGVLKEAEEKAEEKIAPTVEEPKDKTMTTEEAVEKISAELPLDAGVKAGAIGAIQNDEKSTEETKTEALSSTEATAPGVEDKAPASAAAAAEATEVVKSTE